MSLSLVIDVGNSRVKWGRCDERQVIDAVPLPLADPGAWLAQWQRWGLNSSTACTVAGVNPPVIEQLDDWLRSRSAAVRRVESYQQLPLTVAVEAPEQVGMDRLLKAVAANARRPNGAPAILIDAGSAVTVDWVDEAGAFRGGAIFPGVQLMARALAQFTAKLPQVSLTAPAPAMPGTSTTKGIQAGIFGAAVGGIGRLIEQLTGQCRVAPVIFMAGGDAELLLPALGSDVEHWPHMTLEGIRLTAARQP